jgi:hypothetical protein
MTRSVFVDQDQLAAAIERGVAKLDKDEVRRVRYNVGEDWDGETTITIRVLLTDAAVSDRSRLGEIGERISTILSDEVDSYRNWDVLTYFRFRSESEQAELHDPAWE